MIWICGASGLVGKQIEFAAKLRKLQIVSSSSEIDVRSRDTVERFVQKHQPRAVINASGYTDVEAAEANPRAAFEVNAIGAKNLAHVSRKCGARFVQLSTDFVFNGKSDHLYLETDDPDPVSVYGKSKLEGERLVLFESPDAVILRTSWVYGDSPRSFVSKIIVQLMNGKPIQVVQDQIGVPNESSWVAEIVLEVALRSELSGIFHLSAKQFCSRFEWAKAIGEGLFSQGFLKRDPVIEPVLSANFPQNAKRPAFSALNSDFLEKTLERSFPTWKARLSQYLASLDKGG